MKSVRGFRYGARVSSSRSFVLGMALLSGSSACRREAVRPPRSSPTVAQVAPAPSRHVRLAPTGTPLRIETNASGPSRWIAGGVRAELDGSAVAVAPEALDRPILFAGHANGRYRFITQREMFESDSFLGPLRSVRVIERGQFGRGPGAVAVIADGRLAERALPSRAFVLDAGWLDDTRGAAVVEPGRVLITRDAGAHWTAVTLPPASVARSIIAREDRFWVKTLAYDHALAITDAGQVERVPFAQADAFLRAPDEITRAVADGIAAERPDGSDRFVDEGAIGGYSVLARARGSALDGHATTEPITRGVARPTRCRRR